MKFAITREFERLLGESRLASLNAHDNTVYGVDAEFKLAYLNPMWFKFAQVNGNNIFDLDKWSLGSSLFRSIPAAQLPFYKNLFESVLLTGRSTVVPPRSEYECSSPELYRRFSMHLYPIKGAGIVAVHSLIIEEPNTFISIEKSVGTENNYLDNNGILHQCANCRRIRNLTVSGQWDWVPKFVEEPYMKTSHCICEPCMSHYYLS